MLGCRLRKRTTRMETVNFQCSQCGNLMGVSTDHLGSQVQCRHCQAVVRTPAAPTPASQPAASQLAPHFFVPHAAERESIFAGEQQPSDDLFCGPSEPLVQMPADARKAQAAANEPAPKNSQD